MKNSLLSLTLLFSITINYAQIYVAGIDYSTTSNWDYNIKGALWKNGELYYIGDTTAQFQPSDIFVSDTNVYIIGNIDDNYFDYYGQLWINGTLQNLADSGYWTCFNSIVVNNGDIYIAGYTKDSSSY
jgi:hypothetical protein